MHKRTFIYCFIIIVCASLVFADSPFIANGKAATDMQAKAYFRWVIDRNFDKVTIDRMESARYYYRDDIEQIPQLRRLNPELAPIFRPENTEDKERQILAQTPICPNSTLFDFHARVTDIYGHTTDFYCLEVQHHAPPGYTILRHGATHGEKHIPETFIKLRPEQNPNGLLKLSFVDLNSVECTWEGKIKVKVVTSNGEVIRGYWQGNSVPESNTGKPSSVELKITLVGRNEQGNRIEKKVDNIVKIDFNTKAQKN